MEVINPYSEKADILMIHIYTTVYYTKNLFIRKPRFNEDGKSLPGNVLYDKYIMKYKEIQMTVV
jgi:hypothetical protein